MAKDLEMGYLLDFYGEVLTQKQREMLRQYYNDDLSLSEIGENFGITRQGARDAIKHGETTLKELEEKVGFAARYRRVQQKLEQLEQLRLLQAGIPIRVLEVPPMGAGVDTPEDLERVRAAIRGRRRLAALEKLKRVRLVITDVDGVLTDGGLYYGPDGECLKRFHARDGLGVKLLQKAGIRVAVLSGRDCPSLRRRLTDLGITEAVLGKLDKRSVISSLMEQCGVQPEEIAFVGDDIPDMEVFGLCGVSVTVNDAPDYVKAVADVVLENKGGQGAFRELTDKIVQ